MVYRQKNKNIIISMYLWSLVNIDLLNYSFYFSVSDSLVYRCWKNQKTFLPHVLLED